MFLSVKNAPVAIDPGVTRIEVEMSVTEDSVRRDFPAVLHRIPPSREAARALPVIVTVRDSHIFSTTQNIAEATLLLQYTNAGEISAVFTRDSDHSWERSAVPDEYAGRTIKQFSARYIFKTVEERNECMRLVENLVIKVRTNKINENDMDTVREVFRLLSRSSVGPVACPVAVLAELAPSK
jgi:hypothetical protein